MHQVHQSFSCDGTRPATVLITSAIYNDSFMEIFIFLQNIVLQFRRKYFHHFPLEKFQEMMPAKNKMFFSEFFGISFRILLTSSKTLENETPFF